MSARLPARCLRDWRPEIDPPEEDWLADLYDHGWVPDHMHGGAPSLVSIDSNPVVHRWAMVEIPSDGPELSW